MNPETLKLALVATLGILAGNLHRHGDMKKAAETLAAAIAADDDELLEATAKAMIEQAFPVADDEDGDDDPDPMAVEPEAEDEDEEPELFDAEDDGEAEEETEEDGEEPVVFNDAWTKAEIAAKAEEAGIKLPENATKAQMLEAVKAAGAVVQ